jgi:predicted RNase H-like nuclease (RuvC/YqgF family)
MPEPEILTDPNQMLARALAAKDAEIDRLKGVELWFTEAVDAMHAEVDDARSEVITLEWKLSEAEKEIDRLRDGLQNALAAIDWMFAAQQPLRDPWFAHRDELIARAREALGRSNG